MILSNKNKLEMCSVDRSEIVHIQYVTPPYDISTLSGERVQTSDVAPEIY